VHSKEQEQLNETVRYLMENLGYCGKCAFQALTITASSTSILTETPMNKTDVIVSSDESEGSSTSSSRISSTDPR
jgi:hypothetical protein